jgi:hypothetical protein
VRRSGGTFTLFVARKGNGRAVERLNAKTCKRALIRPIRNVSILFYYLYSGFSFFSEIS